MTFKQRLAMVSLALTTAQIANGKPLTIERLFESPALSGETLRELAISPDSARVTFLKGKPNDYERLDLWEYHIASGTTRLLFDSDQLHQGEEKLSDEEKARRERMRLSGSGIVSYNWSPDGKALLFPLAGDIFYYHQEQGKVRKLVDTPEFETDIRFSPNGNYVSYVRAQNLFVYDLQKGLEKQLTTEGHGDVKMAMAEFVAQEEMGRMTGYWWSDDESKIALTKIDESPVEQVVRSEIYAEEIKTITQRYPFAGKANVKIELGVLALDSGEIDWLDLGKETDIYLPRVQWSKRSQILSYQWQSRDQKKLELRFYDTEKKSQQTVLTESSKTWVNLHHDLHFLKDGKHFIWSSERDGFKHLYLYGMDGKLRNQITQGRWVVKSVAGVDEAKQLIYLVANQSTPLESHLYSVNFNGKQLQQITQASGVHQVVLSTDTSHFIDNFSSPHQPQQTSLKKVNDQRVAWLNENKINDSHPLADYIDDFIEPEFGSIKNDGVELYYRLYKPAGFDPTQKYPVMVYLYGGPHAQKVTKAWQDLFLQLMAQQGYVVFTLDNRGSNYRGKQFEEAIYQAMGSVEVDDQVAGVKFLRGFPWVDPARVGIHGHSYGGYMTLMALFKAGDYFSAGVSGAPVTDWTLYDTHYTERYMGNPNLDPEKYQQSSVFPYATQLKSPLLIYHGMADDNVLFKNSTKLYKLLQDHNIPFFVMDYPGKKHSLRGQQTQMHRLNAVKNFFDLHFVAKTPAR